MSDGRPRALLCVGGGIAAYKAPEIVRALVKEGLEVRVILTAAAGAFVSDLSLASVSGHPVRSRLLDASEEGTIGHIELADWADVVIVAPGTADLMARAAHGLADDLVTCVLLATRAPILWAPAMNTNMWRHPATQANLATLGERGAEFVGPDAGELACGWIGEGRMIDPPVI
ncbi:MAG: bifunctional 4'-phosphopantothenoylcysteine decarboxylase/phosphopantothenoylcysteine synthetase, partial [Myxococcales bacterium]|nr:bifunctional 4'-phosphopantothenoylcysteine decarboxylase/phosphopantothenoylcysteine synthetase [Myxococcales bacterium]